MTFKFFKKPLTHFFVEAKDLSMLYFPILQCIASNPKWRMDISPNPLFTDVKNLNFLLQTPFLKILFLICHSHVWTFSRNNFLYLSQIDFLVSAYLWFLKGFIMKISNVQHFKLLNYSFTYRRISYNLHPALRKDNIKQGCSMGVGWEGAIIPRQIALPALRLTR